MNKNILIITVGVLIFTGFYIMMGTQESDDQCYDCGDGGLQKTTMECPKIESKLDAFECFSNLPVLGNYSWQTPKTIDDIMEVNETVKIKGVTSKPFHTYTFQRFAVDDNGIIYADSYVG